MADVLIFDDDPRVGELVGEVLRGRGLSCAHFPSGAGVVQIVKDARPRLVVLDVMMPGVDGLSACRAIRETPATRHVKIVVLTAKQFEKDRADAKRWGADLFFNKPFKTAELSAGIGGLLGAAEPSSAPPAPPAAPLVAALNEGGLVLEAAGLWVFFDAGKGTARWLASRSTPPSAAWVLLSRYDDDAIAEFRAFAPLLGAGRRVNLAGPDDADSSLQRLAPHMNGLPGQRAPGTPLLFPQREADLQLGPGLMASTRYTQHGGACLAWRLDVQGRRIVWCPANDLPAVAEDWNRHEREKFRALFAGADLLLHGFARGAADPVSPAARYRGAWEPVVTLARDAGVKRLALMPLGGASGAGIDEALTRTGTAAPMDCRVSLPGSGWIL
ncbi:MAG: response regulator [Elusimicrobiota bacterium]|nr:response regulator [Elusimicrobiota bacterium]